MSTNYEASLNPLRLDPKKQSNTSKILANECLEVFHLFSGSGLKGLRIINLDLNCLVPLEVALKHFR